MNKEVLNAADEIIAAALQQGFDYSSVRVAIARAIDEGILEGHWDVYVDLEGADLRDIRLIQEDEYDQHMDEVDDKPLWENLLCSTSFAYVWIV